jgi:hypothetical protein
MKFNDHCKINLKELQKLIKITGLRAEAFNILVSNMREPWEESEKKRLEREERKRKVGGGRPDKLIDLRVKVAVTLVYYRQYFTQSVLAFMFRVNQSTMSRMIERMLPLIEKAADPKLKTYLSEAKEDMESPKYGTWEEAIAAHPELKDVSIDATEQPCYRSQDYKTQEAHYSGKTKMHAIKYQATVSSDSGKILDISKTYNGKMHDKKIIDEEKTVEKLPKKTKKRADAGYTGIAKEHPDSNIILPIKKPKGGKLSEEAKQYNKENSKIRVKVENAFAFIKKFRICQLLFRQPLKIHNQIVRNVAALCNLQLEVRLSLTA